jgi:signal transduction histidine kinase
LGLAIAQAIAQKHHGKLRVERQPEKAFLRWNYHYTAKNQSNFKEQM